VFQLHVLPLRWPDLGNRYTQAEVWPALARADLAGAEFVFGETDVRAYDWDHQEIWLANACTDRIVQTGADKLLRHALGQAFVVTLDGRRLYGGLFYYPGGAAAIRFPVIHALGKPTTFLRIRPGLGRAWARGEADAPGPRNVIADSELFEHLERQRLIQTIPADIRPYDGV
jgi:hypothetical protein